MMVWLGKNWLGQTDKSEITQTSTSLTGIKLID